MIVNWQTRNNLHLPTCEGQGSKISALISGYTDNEKFHPVVGCVIYLPSAFLYLLSTSSYNYHMVVVCVLFTGIAFKL